MYEKFTDRSRKVMALAREEAHRLGHEHLGTEHVLLALIAEGAGVAAHILQRFNVELSKARDHIAKFVQRGNSHEIGNLHETPSFKQLIEHSIDEARLLNHHYVGTEHILLGLLGVTDGVAVAALCDPGLQLDQIRKEVLNLLGCDLVD